jgi:histidine ammonia-lyase
LSFRCASHIHGSLRVALDLLGAALEPELTGAADNPLVLAAEGEIVSNGNFHLPAMALALDATAIAVAQVAGTMTERQVRLKTSRLSDLPPNLVSADPTSSGMAPLTKTAQSLTLEIRHRATPVAILSTIGADGVEDDSTSAMQGALRLAEQLERLRLLVAVELMVGAQAVDLRGPLRLGIGTRAAYRTVRETVAEVTEDRALGPDVERLAAAALGPDVALLARADAAVSGVAAA